MATQKAKQIKSQDLLQLIEKAKDAEACRDMDSVREILRPLWGDIQEIPDFIPYDKSERAELLRLAGFCLAFYGNSKGKKDCLERGRDLLTNAIVLFSELGCPHKLTDAKIFLALCYWYEGATEECETILSDAEARYEGNKQHDVYLQIRYYRMITHVVQKEYEAAAEIIEELGELIKGCTNKRIIGLFHTEAGVLSRKQKKYSRSHEHITKAIEYARELGSGGLEAANLNNLAYLYKETGHFEKAHFFVDQAIEINKELGQIGYLAHKYDTKALIYFEVRDYKNALFAIEKSIELADRGEDYAALADALIDKCKIVMRLGQIENGLKVFTELMDVARFRLGKAATNRYAEEYAKLIYPKRGVAYREEVRLFQKDLIRNALLESDNVTSKAKDILLISQKGLSEILNKQFPELCEEVGLKRSSSQRKITPVTIKNPVLKDYSPERLITFEVYREKLPGLKFEDDVVVAVLKGSGQFLEPGKFFLVQCQVRNILECGRLCREESLGFFYFENDGDPCPFTPKDVKVIGEIVGYCNKSEAKEQDTRFIPIE